jgi:hypothetical protein
MCVIPIYVITETGVHAGNEVKWNMSHRTASPTVITYVQADLITELSSVGCDVPCCDAMQSHGTGDSSCKRY